jgi:hypothetical protein
MTHPTTPLPSKIAAIVIGFFSLGPLATALDLLTPVLPSHPTIEIMRSGSLLLKLFWIASGPLGIAAFILLMQRRFSGFVLTLPFAVTSLIGGNLLWQQPRPVAVVLIVLACVLAGFGAQQARADDATAADPSRDAARENPPVHDEIPDSVEAQCELLLDPKHMLHEEIVWRLQQRKDPYAIPFLRQAVLLKPQLEHLSYDDYGAYYKKCFWALRAIGTAEAIAVIEEFAESSDAVVREQAKYRLFRIRGDE